MKYLSLTLLIIFNLVAKNHKIIRLNPSSPMDSLFCSIKYDGDDIHWRGPRQRLYAYYHGYGYYKREDHKSLIAYGDTIVNPTFTGKCDSCVNHGNFRDCYGITSLKDTTMIDGILNNGLPYYLDSLIIACRLGRGCWLFERPPMKMNKRIVASKFWHPNMFPSYVKWRDKDPYWRKWYGFWPEVFDMQRNLFRPDSNGFKFKVGDKVEVMPYLFPNYHTKFMYGNKNNPKYKKYKAKWEFEVPVNYPVIGEDGIVTDIKLSDIDPRMMYYKVKTEKTHRWHVVEELRYIPNDALTHPEKYGMFQALNALVRYGKEIEK